MFTVTNTINGAKVIANEKITKGQIVLREAPLVYFPYIHMHDDPDDNEISKYEQLRIKLDPEDKCGVEILLTGLMLEDGGKKAKQFLNSKAPRKGQYNSLIPKGVLEKDKLKRLTKHYNIEMKPVTKLVQAVRSSLFSIYSPYLGEIGVAIYETIPFFRNRCVYANCTTLSTPDEVFVVAEKDIMPGEELTLSQITIGGGMPLLKPAARNEYLNMRYGFKCKCEDCAETSDKGKEDEMPSVDMSSIPQTLQRSFIMLLPNWSWRQTGQFITDENNTTLLEGLEDAFRDQELMLVLFIDTYIRRLIHSVGTFYNYHQRINEFPLLYLYHKYSVNGGSLFRFIRNVCNRCGYSSLYSESLTSSLAHILLLTYLTRKRRSMEEHSLSEAQIEELKKEALVIGSEYIESLPAETSEKFDGVFRYHNLSLTLFGGYNEIFGFPAPQNEDENEN